MLHRLQSKIDTDRLRSRRLSFHPYQLHSSKCLKRVLATTSVTLLALQNNVTTISNMLPHRNIRAFERCAWCISFQENYFPERWCHRRPTAYQRLRMMGARDAWIWYDIGWYLLLFLMPLCLKASTIGLLLTAAVPVFSPMPPARHIARVDYI